MNTIAAVKEYVNNMIQDVAGSMKVVLLDPETIQTVSMVYSHSDLLSRGCVLVSSLAMEGREDMHHVTCVVHVRPTAENITLLARELKKPKYGSYYLYFSNELSKAQLQELAEADEREVVHQVQEFYADFLATNTNLFSVGLPMVGGPTPDTWHPEVLARVSDGLFAALCALKVRPSIRYAGMSPRARQLAQDMRARVVKNDEIFSDFNRPGTPLLLILDRRDDPVTPLLSQWTYQAMVHELIGIHNNRAQMFTLPGAKEDTPDVLLSPDQDEFYRQAMFQNFGDLGDSLKTLVDGFRTQDQTTRSISTLEDMKRFIEAYPEFRKKQGSVSRHVAISSELSKLVNDRNLMNISELEQEIATQNNQSAHVRALQELIADRNNDVKDLLRPALLYALRYETVSNESTAIMEALLARGLSHDDARLFRTLLAYGGASVRSGDLFKNKSLVSRLRQRVTRGAAVVESVFAQHTTVLQETLVALAEGRLSERDTDFPYMHGTPTRDRPMDVIVFMVGGATYEEAAATVKPELMGMRVVLGSSWIHNSRSFLEEVAHTVAGTTPAVLSVASAAGVRSKYRGGGAEAGPA